jgi:hypothetical protein
MGTADVTNVGRPWRPSRAAKTPQERNFLPRHARQQILPRRGKPSGNQAMADVRKNARSKDTEELEGEPPVTHFLERHRNASLWVISVTQGAAMLGLNLLLRALVS